MGAKQTQICFDCIHKDVCKFTEEAARVEAEMKKCSQDTPLKISCKRKHEDTL